MSSESPPPRRVFLLAFVALLTAEVLRLYWIMPFPGSQGGDTIARAYALHQAIWPARIVLGALLSWSAWRIVAAGGWRGRLAVVAALTILTIVVWQANGPMAAEVIFRPPETLTFADAATTTLPARALVLGVALPGANGEVESRAYPIRFVGHHHQVRDVVAGQEVMVTYCTVCRTGRVYRPRVDGAIARFRLVGMDRWNALFEDDRTGSWWRQANGEAVAGPLAGRRLDEIESRQMTWSEWSALHPRSTVMEPDPGFAAEYADLEGYEEGTRPGELTGRDDGSWNEKSWVVGVVAGGAERAFDWNELVEKRLLNDRVGDLPVVVTLAADGVTFRAFDARHPTSGTPLVLVPGDTADQFRDPATGSRWSAAGLALDGPDAGRRLAPLRAFQEFWHSWRTFHPQTTARR